MSRILCPNCHFPPNACLCDVIQRISPTTRVWVMQHPAEVSHGKNSARLLPLLLTQCEVFIGETAGDFAPLRRRLDAMGLNPWLLYPDIEGDKPRLADTTTDRHRVLLLLDGTWRKAHKMYHLNPWLWQLPRLSLQPERPSAYKIRRAGRDDSLSTLEAAAQALAVLEPGLDVSPMLVCFNAMVSRRIAAMPAMVRRRYLDP